MLVLLMKQSLNLNQAIDEVEIMINWSFDISVLPVENFVTKIPNIKKELLLHC